MKQMKKEFSCLDDQKRMILVKLEGLRGKRKMPVAEIAALMGKSPSYYSVALNRGCALTVESLAKIAAVFGRKIELRLVRGGRSRKCEN